MVNYNKSRLKNLDGFVKSPFAALRYILRHCGVAITTPLSSGFARLATEAFYFAVQIFIGTFKNMFCLFVY